LGDHVTQKGSLVAPDRVRFDFSHNTQVTQDQLFAIEDMVNSLVRENFSTSTKIQSMNQAIDEGAMALFGEKYGDRVRVVSIGDSKELCGGTHVERAGEIGLFKIVTECSIASGVRRIEALTGQEAINYMRDSEINLKKVAESVKAPISEITNRLSIFSQERKESEAKIKNLYKKLASAENIKSTEINGMNFISHAFTDIPASIIREFVLQQQRPKTVIAFTATEKSKTVLIVKVSKDLTDKISAKELVSTATGRGCGGNAELAQMGCDTDKINHIITAICSKVADVKELNS
jgi:alanyl-tRNA synthetase